MHKIMLKRQLQCEFQSCFFHVFSRARPQGIAIILVGIANQLRNHLIDVAIGDNSDD
jgi:hypothetical protein